MAGTLRWIMTVIYHDADLLRAWLEHYAELGVPEMLIGVVDQRLMEQVRRESRDFNARIYSFDGMDPFNINNKEEIEDSIRSHHQIDEHDYCIYADLDEFMEYPRHLSEIVDGMNERGYWCIAGRFQDRLAADGSLKEYDPEKELGGQYPIGTQLTRYLGEEDHKVILQRGLIRLQATGHHYPTFGRVDEWPVGNPDGYIVHHFRWRPFLLKHIDERLKRNRWGRYEYALNNLRKMFVENRGRVDLTRPVIDPINYGPLRHPLPHRPDPRVPATMKAPNDSRGVWRNVILQIKVTNICDLSCNNCSAGVGLTRKKHNFFMSPEQFREACRSLRGFRGLVGMFGGNPCLHPKFEELCQIFKEEIPCRDQRGLWTNRVFKHGKLCEETFGQYQNINLHRQGKAADEFRQSWPSARILEHSGDRESTHAPIAVSPRDLGYTEEERLKMIGSCAINQRWSAAITIVGGQLKAYFCEIAATFAEMTGDGSKGVDPYPGWALEPMSKFAHQVEHYCHDCGVPLNGRKVVDLDENASTAVSQTHLEVAKLGTKRLHVVSTKQEVEGGETAIRYLPQIG